jgi:hypothetical protein
MDTCLAEPAVYVSHSEIRIRKSATCQSFHHSPSFNVEFDAMRMRGGDFLVGRCAPPSWMFRRVSLIPINYYGLFSPETSTKEPRYCAPENLILGVHDKRSPWPSFPKSITCAYPHTKHDRKIQDEISLSRKNFKSVRLSYFSYRDYSSKMVR